MKSKLPLSSVPFNMFNLHRNKPLKITIFLTTDKQNIFSPLLLSILYCDIHTLTAAPPLFAINDKMVFVFVKGALHVCGVT